ncbi:MAG: GNAT family N-acetyltransferase [Rhodospirillaceae bacterium]|nr:GNAT family N-acetyltransferase [Rhodospirillaceae bacterium]
MSGLTLRAATRADIPVLMPLMDTAIRELLKPYLDPAGIEASFEIMGLDTQLIDDGTYFAALLDGEIAGCGGWSRRATLFGGDHAAGRDAGLLNPATDAARVRAMYTSPRFTRRGVGRAILAACEAAARAEGFSRVELVATMAGQPLYTACGYAPIEAMTSTTSTTSRDVTVPLMRMGKRLTV